MAHMALETSYRTFGGEHLLLLIVSSLFILLLWANSWSLTRRYSVTDSNGHTASRHWNLYLAVRAARVMNRHARATVYSITTS